MEHEVEEEREGVEGERVEAERETKTKRLGDPSRPTVTEVEDRN